MFNSNFKLVRFFVSTFFFFNFFINIESLNDEYIKRPKTPEVFTSLNDVDSFKKNIPKNIKTGFKNTIDKKSEVKYLKKIYVDVLNQQKKKKEKNFFILKSGYGKKIIMHEKYVKDVPKKILIMMNPELFNSRNFYLDDSYVERARKFFMLGLDLINPEYLKFSPVSSENFLNNINDISSTCFISAHNYYVLEKLNKENNEYNNNSILYMAQCMSSAAKCAEYSLAKSKKSKKIVKKYRLIIKSAHESVLYYLNKLPESWHREGKIKFVDVNKSLSFMKNYKKFYG